MTKKQLIMAKSIELFAEYGLEATSVQQITERCGISKGAFYLYFKSKDELIFSIIDDFMSSFIANIEQAVSSQEDRGKLLYDFLYAVFTKFEEQADFAKIFLKEHSFSLNRDLLQTLKNYRSMFNRLLLSVIQKQYSELKAGMQLELFFSINGFMKGYSEFILVDQLPADLERICRAIVEKAGIIARYAHISSISEDYLEALGVEPEISKEAVITLLKETVQENKHDPLVCESAFLLMEDLEKPQLKDVFIEGLLNNIRKNNSGKWAAYMYRQYKMKKSGE